MNFVKNKQRAKLTDESLSHLLRLCTEDVCEFRYSRTCVSCRVSIEIALMSSCGFEPNCSGLTVGALNYSATEMSLPGSCVVPEALTIWVFSFEIDITSLTCPDKLFDKFRYSGRKTKFITLYQTKCFILPSDYALLKVIVDRPSIDVD
ncbi:hypothetical protein M8J77_018623 [Diaphorina citri]|nr:hypothetical protein M8J77_018623 [Diaphorina citri]